PVPGPTPAFRTGRQRENRTAVDVDLLEEAVREEPDVPSIGGPERSLRTLRAGERMRARLRELSHPEKIGVFALPRREDDSLPVRRDLDRSRVDPGGDELRVFRRKDRGAKDARRGCGPGEGTRGDTNQCRQE